MVRAEGIEPSRAEAQRIFMPATAFAARTRRFDARASGSRSGLSLHRLPEGPGLRCCPSSLYTFPALRFSGLGSGLPFQVSPNLGSSASPVSHASTQVSLLKSVASAVPPRPRCWLPTVSYHMEAKGDLHVSCVLSFRVIFSSV